MANFILHFSSELKEGGKKEHEEHDGSYGSSCSLTLQSNLLRSACVCMDRRRQGHTHQTDTAGHRFGKCGSSFGQEQI